MNKVLRLKIIFNLSAKKEGSPHLSDELEIKEDELVSKLKTKILKSFQIESPNFTLKYGEEEINRIELEDENRLIDYNIGDNGIIYVEKELKTYPNLILKSTPSKEFNNFNLNDPKKEKIDKLIDLTTNNDLKTIKNQLNIELFAENLNSSTFEIKNSLCNEIGSNGWNAIHAAIYKEYDEIILFYIEKKGDFNIPTKTGFTPLMLAINKENIEIIKLILTLSNVNVNQITENGSALQLAIQKKKKNIVKILINAKASPYVKDNQGRNAFDICNDPEIHNILENLITFSPSILKSEKSFRFNKPLIIEGYLSKVRNLLVSGINLRYYFLNPNDYTLKRYKKKEDFPNNPKEVLNLIDIQYMQRIKPTWYMRKDLHYFEIVYYAKQIIGTKYISTIKLWMNYIHQYALQAHENKNKIHTKSDLDFVYLDEGSKTPPIKSEKSETLEIVDTKREEDTVQTFFRKNKLVPSKIYDEEEMKKNLTKSTIQVQDDINVNTMEAFPTSFLTKNANEEKVKFDSFEVLKLVGCGSFGKVFLVRKKDDRKIYAMKVLKKRDLILKKKLRYAITETKILKSCNHPFILQIYFSFQTPKNFYLVVDYCPRGDLSNELLKLNQFSEDVARFYIAELILAVEYLHKKNIIYRDLKPENILIDIQGHIKLADFGLSKDNIGDNDKTKSFCGSPAYLSPEVLLNKGKSATGYGKAADLYGIGAVLYELLVGNPPYFSPEIAEMFKRIKEGKLDFPKSLSNNVKDLLKRLLDKNPMDRIGANNRDELKNHPFFKEIDWEKLYNRDYDPPFDEMEISESILKPDKNLKFEDIDYEETTFTHNRVPGFSFAKSGLD